MEEGNRRAVVDYKPEMPKKSDTTWKVNANGDDRAEHHGFSLGDCSALGGDYFLIKRNKVKQKL